MLEPVQIAPIQRLYELDRSPTLFSEQLDQLLRDKQWVEALKALPEGELKELISYLDKVSTALTPTKSTHCL